MTQKNKTVIALDVGAKRIGIAIADGSVRIARPLGLVEVTGIELEEILNVIDKEGAQTIVIGYPRNQSGEATHQTSLVEVFKEKLSAVTEPDVVFQDESLTSVLAEERLRAYGRPYNKGDVDAQAATFILQDYLEQNS